MNRLAAARAAAAEDMFAADRSGTTTDRHRTRWMASDHMDT